MSLPGRGQAIRQAIVPLDDLRIDPDSQIARLVNDVRLDLSVLIGLTKDGLVPKVVRLNDDGTLGGSSLSQITSDGTTVIGIPSSPLITELQDSSGNQQGTPSHPLTVSMSGGASAPLGDGNNYTFIGGFATSSAFNIVPNVGGKKFRLLSCSISAVGACTMILEWPGNVQFIGWELPANGSMFVNYAGSNGILSPATGDGIFGLNTGTTTSGIVCITGQYE